MEAASSLAVLLTEDQALVDQRGQAFQRVDRAGCRSGGDRLCRVQGEPTDEDPQAAEQDLLPAGEELIAPGDGRAQGVLPHGQVLRLPVQERKALLQALQQHLR